MTDFQPSERLRQMRDEVVYLETELRSLHETATDRSLDNDEQTRWNEGEWLRHALIAEGIDLEARERAAASFQSGSFESSDATRRVDGAPNVILEKDPYDEQYQRDVGFTEAARRSIGENKRMNAEGQQAAEAKVLGARTDPMHLRGMDEYILAHSSDAYTRGWAKLLVGNDWAIEPDEKRALLNAQRYQQRWDPERGITLTAANGGALIPAHLDPTVIIVNTGAANPYRQISNVVSINTNVWNGVTSAGIDFTTSTEGGDSTDIAPTFGTKAITVAKAHGTLPVTIEAFEDIDGLTSILPTLLQDGKDRFEVAKFTDGSGTNEPKGVVTSVYAETTRRSNHATHSAMTVTDVIDAQNSLGSRWQPNASWIGSLTYLNRVRLLGSSSYSTWSDQLNEGLSYNIAGRPAYEVSRMSTALSTVTNTAFVYGDFGMYNIVDRVGMSLEYIPHLFSNAVPGVLPNGRRGFYAYFRVGGDVTTVTSFVVSTNLGQTA